MVAPPWTTGPGLAAAKQMVVGGQISLAVRHHDDRNALRTLRARCK
jgi:hypothetical protein